MLSGLHVLFDVYCAVMLRIKKSQPLWAGFVYQFIPEGMKVTGSCLACSGCQHSGYTPSLRHLQC